MKRIIYALLIVLMFPVCAFASNTLGSAYAEPRLVDYTGSNVYPDEVIVKDTDGNLLEYGKDYWYSRPSTSITPGEYIIIVHGMKTYEGQQKNVSYTIKDPTYVYDATAEIVLPMDGETPSDSISYPENAGYKAEVFGGWCTGTVDQYDATYGTKPETFEYGKTYSIQIMITGTTKHVSATTTKLKVNGEGATWKGYGDNYCYYVVSFTAGCPHTNAYLINAVEKTCTTDGYSGDLYCPKCESIVEQGHTEEKMDHDWSQTWSSDSTNHWHACTRGDAQTDVAAHEWEDVIDEEPTCTKKGSKHQKCKICDKVKENSEAEIDMLPHEFGDFVRDREPTCTQEGEKSKHCKNCTARSEITPIDKVAHEFGDFVRDREPTCTLEGEKSKHCKNCTARSEITPIDKLAHPYGDWHIDKDSTATETGTKHRTCSVCGDVQTEEIPKKTPSTPTVNPGGGGSTAQINVVTDLTSLKGVKVSKGKKSFTVKWKKAKKKVLNTYEGYEIQYSLDGSFSDYPPKFVKKSKKSLKVKGLQSKKKYIVRIRAYRQEGNTLHVSNWVKKNVKVK